MLIKQVTNKLLPKHNLDLYNSIKVLYIFCRTIGLSNFKLVRSQNNGINIFIVDKATMLKTVMKYLIFSTINVHNFYGLCNSGEFVILATEFRFKIGFVSRIITHILTVANICTELICTKWNIWILNQVSFIDRDFQKLSVKIPHR